MDSDLIEGLLPSDLPRALRWVPDQPEDRNPTSKFNRLMKCIICRAISHLEDAQVLEAFARAVLARLRKHDFGSPDEAEGVARESEAHPEHRLEVAHAMLPHFQNANHDSLLITRWGFPFIKPGDLDWLLWQLRTETSREVQEKVSRLVSWIFFPDDAKRIDSVITASQICMVLSDVLAFWLAPMILGSDAATNSGRLDEIPFRQSVSIHVFRHDRHNEFRPGFYQPGALGFPNASHPDQFHCHCEGYQRYACLEVLPHRDAVEAG